MDRYRFCAMLLVGYLTIWSLIVRLALRRGLLFPDSPRLILLAADFEIPGILRDWDRVAPRQRLVPISPLDLDQFLSDDPSPLLVALSLNFAADPNHSYLIERLELTDSRFIQTISVINLFEQQQERLPPALLPDSSLSYNQLPWSAPFSVQSQLKRLADVLVASGLLLLTSPFVGFAALLIWLEDNGPLFYSQQRSGWMGRPFTVLKLRTMREYSNSDYALWTQPGDQRITAVGHLLRRFRLDELPQLLSVINGEMSLIGPRPERPELEHDLENHISHYRKRHWMRPGLAVGPKFVLPTPAVSKTLTLSFHMISIICVTLVRGLIWLFSSVRLRPF